MTVHSLVLFDNGAYTEVSKALDISVHNSIVSPATHGLVEDNYITFFYPNHLSTDIAYEYARAHKLHLIETDDKLESDINGLRNDPISFENWVKPECFEGYKMFRIHYYTENPIHWVVNPETDLFVFNSDLVESLAVCN